MKSFSTRIWGFYAPFTFIKKLHFYSLMISWVYSIKYVCLVGVSSGVRFSNGLDPEPWRCRRTDGKKWRCSKEVAPDQKYCERHAHKTRSRSRKPVEPQSHNTKDNTNTLLSAANQQTR